MNLEDVSFLESKATNWNATLLLAHGAGAPMDSPVMNLVADALVAQDFRVIRFEFRYMADRRVQGRRIPPPKAESLKSEFLAAVRAAGGDAKPLLIGGKSMGGRVASMVADQLFDEGKILGLVCLGYPFHPAKRPDSLRTRHLEQIRVPTLICQGERDPLGTIDDVSRYALSPAIEFLWLKDGDHDLRPRGRQTGLELHDNLCVMAAGVSGWFGRKCG